MMRRASSGLLPRVLGTSACPRSISFAGGCAGKLEKIRSFGARKAPSSIKATASSSSTADDTVQTVISCRRGSSRLGAWLRISNSQSGCYLRVHVTAACSAYQRRQDGYARGTPQTIWKTETMTIAEDDSLSVIDQ